MEIWPRKILHIDMDAFFAAVEQRDRPELRGKPVVVGGNPHGRGVVSTASYEARKFGIHSAMPAAEALRRCPEAVFLRPEIEKYSRVSDTIHTIISKYTDLIEWVSIDEAYLDITVNTLAIEDPVLLAKMIQQNIKAVTQITGSIGVAPNKFLAKIASDMNKPNGLTVVEPARVRSFLENMPVRKIPGVGPVSEKELNKLGNKTIGEIAKKTRGDLIRLFAKWGNALYDRAQGIDERPIETETELKQMGSEETFERDLLDFPSMIEKIKSLSEDVAGRLKSRQAKAKTVTLKVKYSDFTVITRAHTHAFPFDTADIVFEEAVRLLREKTEAGKRPIRLLGVSASHFAGENVTVKKQEDDLFSGIE